MTARPAEECEALALLCEGLLRFARAEIHPLQIDREGQIPSAVLSGLAEMGFFGLSIPERWGGAGFSLRGVCDAVLALARLDRSVATTVGLHLGLGTRGLVAFGSDELRAAFLPELAAGKKIAAFAATESGAGSDLAAIATRAVDAAGGRLRVDGGKIYVTNGGLAQVFTIVAATPGMGGARRGHSLLLLERGDTGVAALGEERKLGLRGSSTTSLHLDGVEIPRTRIIGEPGRGMEHLAHVLAWGRTAMAAGCVGAAQVALEAASAHAATRRQFGRTLASFEVVREQLADMAALAFAMEALVHETCAAEDEPFALAALSTAAKVLCSEGDWEICDLAVQLHGGAGFLEESGLPLLLRDARITRIFEGANDVLLAAHGTWLAAAAPAQSEAEERASPATGGARRRAALLVGPKLSGAASAADRLHAAIAQRRDELRARFGVRLLSQQRLLHRLGRLGILSAAADAAVLCAESEGDAQSRQLATHFVALAEARAAPLFAEPAALDPIDAIASVLIARHAP